MESFQSALRASRPRRRVRHKKRSLVLAQDREKGNSPGRAGVRYETEEEKASKPASVAYRLSGVGRVTRASRKNVALPVPGPCRHPDLAWPGSGSGHVVERAASARGLGGIGHGHAAPCATPWVAQVLAPRCYGARTGTRHRLQQDSSVARRCGRPVRSNLSMIFLASLPAPHGRQFLHARQEPTCAIRGDAAPEGPAGFEHSPGLTMPGPAAHLVREQAAVISRGFFF